MQSAVVDSQQGVIFHPGLTVCRENKLQNSIWYWNQQIYLEVQRACGPGNISATALAW